MKVLFPPLVRLCFQEMGEILYEKEYFGIEDSAIQYVRELIFEIRICSSHLMTFHSLIPSLNKVSLLILLMLP